MTRRRLASTAVALSLAGCTGNFTHLAPPPPPQHVTTREATGSACGVLLFNLIPIQFNDRTERAYQQALQRADAEGLLDTTVTDRWYFIYVGGLYCTDVHGVGFRAAATKTP